MDQTITVALILSGVWLGVLTLVVVLLVRQIGLLTLRLSIVSTSTAFSVADDGPEIESEAPEVITSAFPQLLERQPVYLLFVSATCGPCRDLAAELNGHRDWPDVIALVTGREELAEGLVELLPSEFQIVRDPEANKFAKSLQIQSTPFAIEFTGGTVNKKAYLYNASDFVTLFESYSSADANNSIRIPEEVLNVS